jgi:hypothetical protein
MVMDSDARIRSGLTYYIDFPVVLTATSLAETGLDASGPLHGSDAAISTSNLVKHDRANVGGSLSENAGALIYLQISLHS